MRPDKFLFYNNYCSGRSGLSNGVMSVEVAVALASLTGRTLALEGNVTPPANVVHYERGVDTKRRSTITDLIELPVPWVVAEEVDLSGLERVEWTEAPLWDTVFVAPHDRETTTQDFARGVAPL